MVSLAYRRKVGVLVLSLVFMTPWAAQAIPDRPTSEPHADVVPRLVEWFVALLGDIGCSMDPDGRCRGTASQPVPPLENVDVGCSWDPGGGTYGNRG